jgi:hypothetical protein
VSEPRIELHGSECACRGGAWVLLESTQRSPCGNDTASDVERLVLGLAEWRQLGKPGNLAAFEEAQRRADAGERRQFQRFEVTLPVRLARIATWRDPSTQAEDTLADVIAAGGALVRSRMAIEKGELVRFAIGEAYDTRAEVMYVSLAAGDDMDGAQRLGLRFLDAPLPESLIPQGARPLD